MRVVVLVVVVELVEVVVVVVKQVTIKTFGVPNPATKTAEIAVSIALPFGVAIITVES